MDGDELKDRCKPNQIIEGDTCKINITLGMTRHFKGEKTLGRTVKRKIVRLRRLKGELKWTVLLWINKNFEIVHEEEGG